MSAEVSEWMREAAEEIWRKCYGTSRLQPKVAAEIIARHCPSALAQECCPTCGSLERFFPFTDPVSHWECSDSWHESALAATPPSGALCPQCKLPMNDGNGCHMAQSTPPSGARLELAEKKLAEFNVTWEDGRYVYNGQD